MRCLSLIWLWDPATLSEEDAGNVRLWRELNPDWVVKLWGGDELTAWIAVHYPWAKQAWDEIVAQYRADGKKSHLAKLSDFARYLLLHHDHAPEFVESDGLYGTGYADASPVTEFNAYFDCDCTPTRALSDLLEDKVIIGENVRRVKEMPRGVTRRRVDFSKLDILISGENFSLIQGRVQITNCAIITRPGHPFFENFVTRGIRARKLSVLRSFGPWALSADVARQKQFLKMEILPWHYANFSPGQVSGPVPPWNVCLHRNEISWGSPELKMPWLA